MKKLLIIIIICGMYQSTIAQKSKSANTKKGKPALTKRANTKNPSSKKFNTLQAYKKGDMQINAGIGLIGFGIPIYAGLDYFVTNDISLGVEGSFNTFNETNYLFEYQPKIYGVAVVGNFHFNKVLKIPAKYDFYAGFGINYFKWTYENAAFLEDTGTGVGFGAQLGGRYFFSKKFAVNIELGGSSTTSATRFGITYKL